MMIQTMTAGRVAQSNARKDSHMESADEDRHGKTMIRGARVEEIPQIIDLFAEEVAAGRMLPRGADEIKEQIQNWLVAEHDDVLVGCVSLVFFNHNLCEVRSLAVHEAFRGNGLGGELIQSAVDLAKSRDAKRVLTLTRAASVFKRLGFQEDFVDNFPEKVWKDCAPCPLKDRCDEIALIYPIKVEGSHGTDRV